MKIFHSRRFWVASFILIGIFWLRSYPFATTFTIVMLAILYNPYTGKPLLNYRFWIVIILLTVIVPVFTGQADTKFIGIAYSASQLEQMIIMSLRGISVFFLFQVLTINLNSQFIRELFGKIGLSNFDILFTLSKQSIPSIQSILRARANQLRPIGVRRLPLHILPSFIITILNDILSLADELSSETSNELPPSASDVIKHTFENPQPLLIIVIGDPGCGKTPWVLEIINELKQKSVSVAGMISKKVVISDVEWYHELEDIMTGDTHTLNTMDQLNGEERYGKFSFSPGVFDWALRKIKPGLKSEWFVIDEIGPLEFDGKGFASILENLNSNFQGKIVITIRTNLKDKVDELLAPYGFLSGRPRKLVELPIKFGRDVFPILPATDSS